MKPGTPIHVGGGHLVHACHAIAFIPDHAGVMWHTLEDGYVLLTYDVRGHLVVQVIISEVDFLRENRHKFLDRGVPRGPGEINFFKLLLETALKKTEPK